jgi:hypothetical protein
MDSAMHGRRLAATLRHLCARSCAGGGDAEAAVETETKEEGFRWAQTRAALPLRPSRSDALQ